MKAALRCCAFWLAAAAAVTAHEERFKIVSASNDHVTFLELVPAQVAIDTPGQAFHYRGCPSITSTVAWTAPGAATLRGYRAHCPERRRPEYATRTEPRAPRNPKLRAVLFLGNSLTYYNQMPAMTEELGGARIGP